MAKIEAIRRTSTAEAIVENLLSRVRNGEFGPGDRLPSERKLQNQLGVGRLSLREALARLSALGVVRIDHGRGAFVQERVSSETLVNALVPSFADINAKRLHDLVNARSLIEGELAALAARNRTDSDVRRLRELLDYRRQNARSAEELAEIDHAFHREIARIADNDFLNVVVGALADHIKSFLLHFYIQEGRDQIGVIKRHEPIVEAIVAGDGEKARVYARKHIDASKSNLDDYVRWVKEERENGNQ